MSSRPAIDPQTAARNEQLLKVVTKLNPRNHYEETRADGQVTLVRDWCEDKLEPADSEARWTKRYEAELSARQDNEHDRLEEADDLNIDRVAKFANLDKSVSRVRSIKRKRTPALNTASKKSTIIVLPDYGLDLDAWKRLLPSSKGCASNHPAFALSCVRAIWRALLAMREGHMVHGDLKPDNIAIPIVSGSLHLGADRRTVTLQIDMAELRLIDLEWALSSNPVDRKPLKNSDGKYTDYPKGDYISPAVLEAYKKADPTQPAGIRNPALLQDVDWRADIFSLAVLIEKWVAEIELNNSLQTNTNAFATLKKLTPTFRAMHDDKALADARSGQIIPLIDNALNGADEWQKVPIEINLLDVANRENSLLDVANRDNSLADQYAELIAPKPAPAPTPKADPPQAPPVNSRNAGKVVMLSAALIAVGAVAYQSIPTPPIKPEPPIVIVEPLPPPPPPPKETYRDRTAKIKQSPWWLSETPPPAGNAEKAWLSETRALAAKNDMAARINLGLASLGRLVAGVDRGEAMKTLASGLMLADTQSLAGENAGVVKEGACKATLLALFVGDSAMEQAAAPAFAHLATLNNYDSALTAGHLYACKFTSAESGKAGEFYKMAAGAPDPKLREAAKLALTSLEAKSPMCHFEMPVPELKQKLQACGQP